LGVRVAGDTGRPRHGQDAPDSNAGTNTTDRAGSDSDSDARTNTHAADSHDDSNAYAGANTDSANTNTNAYAGTNTDSANTNAVSDAFPGGPISGQS